MGGNARWIAIGMLLAIGAILTLAPVVYTVLERTEMLKVAAVLLLLVIVGGVFAISSDVWRDVPQIVTNAGMPAGSSLRWTAPFPRTVRPRPSSNRQTSVSTS